VTGAAAPALPFFADATAGERKALVVSLHDVAPPTRGATERMLSELEHRGLRVASLLVVPDYHHTGKSTDDREFTLWLRDLESVGHEIVIHGYYHERPRQPNESWPAKLMTRHYTTDEGEFYDLDYAEALRRITRAREEFTAAGLHPRGFIAPAWLLSETAERAALDAEMEYTTRLTSVRDLRTRATFSSRSLVYSVRNSWRRAASLAWNGTLAPLLAASPLLRLSLHPPDIEHHEIWRQVTRLLVQFAGTRTATTYRDWIGEQRTESQNPNRA
jgi:predicted deacetylase